MGKSRTVSKRKTEESMPKLEERRKQERFNCAGFAEVVVDDAAFLFRGNIQNVSLGGCYIQSPARLRLIRGTEADLHFNLCGDLFHARARIMIVRAGAGAGFEFLPDNPELQRRIAGVIQRIRVESPHRGIGAAVTPDTGEKHSSARSLWSQAH